MPWMQRPSPSGCTITTSSASASQPASSAETASVDFPAPLCPRSSNARPSRTIAAPWSTKRSWRASNHASGRYTHPSKKGSAARSGRWICALVPATVMTRPDGAETTTPSGPSQNLIPSISECGGTSWRLRRLRVDRDRGHRFLGRRVEDLEAGAEVAVALVVRRPQCDGHTCDVDDTGRHEPRRVASLRVITEPPGSSANSSAPVDLFPGFSRDALQAVLGVHPVALRHVFANDPQFAPDVIAPLVAELPRSWIRAEHAQYSPHEPRGFVPLPADIDLDAAVRALPNRRRRSARTTSSTLPNSATSTPRSTRRSARWSAVRRAVSSPSTWVRSWRQRTWSHPRTPIVTTTSARRVGQERGVGRGRSRPARASPPRRSISSAVPKTARRSCRPGDVSSSNRETVCTSRRTRSTGRPCSTVPRSGSRSVSAPTSTVRSSRVHDFDVRLRRRGLRPRPSGPGSTKEKVKARLAAASVQAARMRDRVIKRPARDTVTAEPGGSRCVMTRPPRDRTTSRRPSRSAPRSRCRWSASRARLPQRPSAPRAARAPTSRRAIEARRSNRQSAHRRSGHVSARSVGRLQAATVRDREESMSESTPATSSDYEAPAIDAARSDRAPAHRNDRPPSPAQSAAFRSELAEPYVAPRIEARTAVDGSTRRLRLDPPPP